MDGNSDVPMESMSDSEPVKMTAPLYDAIGRKALSRWLEVVGLNGALKPRAKALALALAARLNHRDGRLCPSLAVLQVDTGMSEATVLAAIRDLEAAGLLQRSRRTALRTNGPEKLSNAYRIIPPKTDERTPVSEDQVESLPEPLEDNRREGDLVDGGGSEPGIDDALSVPLQVEPDPETVRNRRRDLQAGTVSTALGARDLVRQVLGVEVPRRVWGRAYGLHADPASLAILARLLAAAGG